MLHRLLIAVILALVVTSCTDNAPVVPPARKEALRKILLPKLAATSIPADREDDFFQIVDAFDVGRRKDEFVRSVEFAAGSEATLGFADGGMHGGGVVTLKKKAGKWTVAQKTYFL